jgi:hypothetical protein
MSSKYLNQENQFENSTNLISKKIDSSNQNITSIKEKRKKTFDSVNKSSNSESLKTIEKKSSKKKIVIFDESKKKKKKREIE